MNAERPTLPELSDARLDEIEEALFAQIGRDRTAQLHTARDGRRRRRRRGLWLGAAAAALVVVAAVAIGPMLAGGGLSSASSDARITTLPGGVAQQPGPLDESATTSGGSATGSSGSSTADGAKATSTRKVAATATATLTAKNAASAAHAIGEHAQMLGGYVDSLSTGDATAGDTATTPVGAGGDASVTVRVPADKLTAAIDDLDTFGTVVASRIDKQDVTTQSIDLQAQVDALKVSVARLTELMGKSGSVADLLTAEKELSSRQAELEAAQQQLAQLGDQVAMSTLTVTVTTRPPAASANPKGFADGLTTGWNGLVAALNGLVIGLGFLAPWIAVLVVIGLAVWGIRRLVRRRRVRRAAARGLGPAGDDA